MGVKWQSSPHPLGLQDLTCNVHLMSDDTQKNRDIVFHMKIHLTRPLYDALILNSWNLLMKLCGSDENGAPWQEEFMVFTDDEENKGIDPPYRTVPQRQAEYYDRRGRAMNFRFISTIFLCLSPSRPL